MKRIAILTQISDSTYEVFQIATFTDESEIYNRWVNIFSSNNYSVDKYENHSTLPFWRTEYSEEFHERASDESIRCFVIVQDGIIAGSFTFFKDSLEADKFDAAISGHIIGIPLEEETSASLGDIWNGHSFSNPS